MASASAKHPSGICRVRSAATKSIFRHPQLGERHETVVVTVQGTVRLGVDLRKK